MNTRECNQCGDTYRAGRGVGGGSAHGDDAERFPYSENTRTGVRPERPWWMNGAYCGDDCYGAAYHEPPAPYGPE